jgi:hypothetical protein
VIQVLVGGGMQISVSELVTVLVIYTAMTGSGL